MSDNAIFVICLTVLMLGMFALAGFVAWVDSPRRSRGGSPKETPQISPRGGRPPMWTTTTTEPAHGHQPTRTVNRDNPPKSGSAVRYPGRAHRPHGKPVDLHTVTPPQQPSAVQLPKDGEG